MARQLKTGLDPLITSRRGSKGVMIVEASEFNLRPTRRQWTDLETSFRLVAGHIGTSIQHSPDLKVKITFTAEAGPRVTDEVSLIFMSV